MPGLAGIIPEICSIPDIETLLDPSVHDNTVWSPENIQSIPVRLGLGRTRQLLNILNTVSGLAILVAVISGILPLPWIVFFANAVLVSVVTNFLFDRLSSNRLISHALIFFQIVLACVLGVVA